MQEFADTELLRLYARENSQEAFAALVARHVNLVYSAALRKTGNAHAAEEVTQAVFTILAKKARALRTGTVLSGWLYQTARLTAANFLRTEIRRVHREQEAYMQSISGDTESEAWTQIMPLLEDGMGQLSEKDRNAIVLRFFEGRSFQEIGSVFGANENVAKKRVGRALENLRKHFAKCGVAWTAAIIAETISANSVQAAPVALTKAVVAGAIVKGAAGSGSALALMKPAVGTLTCLKATTLAVILTNAFVSRQIIASHFSFTGQANGWTTRSQYWLLSTVIGFGVPLSIVAIGYLLRFLPINQHTFKIPNRDYWLSPERRDEMLDYLFRHFLRIACRLI